MTVVKRRKGVKQPVLDMKLVIDGFKAFRAARTTEATAKTTAEQLRDQLMPLLETFGQAHGETGVHRALDLPEPIDGFVRIVRRSNTSQYFDIDAAQALCAKKKVLDDVQTTTITLSFSGTAAEAQRVMDAVEDAGLEKMGCTVDAVVYLEQDKVYALHQKSPEVITEADLDSLLVDDVKYSFVPEK